MRRAGSVDGDLQAFEVGRCAHLLLQVGADHEQVRAVARHVARAVRDDAHRQAAGVCVVQRRADGAAGDLDLPGGERRHGGHGRDERLELRFDVRLLEIALFLSDVERPVGRDAEVTYADEVLRKRGAGKRKCEREGKSLHDRGM